MTLKAIAGVCLLVLSAIQNSLFAQTLLNKSEIEQRERQRSRIRNHSVSGVVIGMTLIEFQKKNPEAKLIERSEKPALAVETYVVKGVERFKPDAIETSFTENKCVEILAFYSKDRIREKYGTREKLINELAVPFARGMTQWKDALVADNSTYSFDIPDTQRYVTIAIRNDAVIFVVVDSTFKTKVAEAAEETRLAAMTPEQRKADAEEKRIIGIQELDIGGFPLGASLKKFKAIYIRATQTKLSRHPQAGVIVEEFEVDTPGHQSQLYATFVDEKLVRIIISRKKRDGLQPLFDLRKIAGPPDESKTLNGKGITKLFWNLEGTGRYLRAVITTETIAICLGDEECPEVYWQH